MVNESEKGGLGHILAGDKIHLAEDHFVEGIAGLLQQLVLDLGAQIVVQRREATIVIQNPSSPAADLEKQRIIALAKLEPPVTPIHAPHHWLSLCHHRQTRVDVSFVLKTKPIFFRNTQPLRAWVSLNVARKQDEQPNAAHKAVVDTLVEGGALIVKKRAQADVLVVDPTSTFYLTVKEERAKNNRVHQELVERDWVEDCSRKKKVVWAPEKEADGTDAGEESFGEEEMRPKRGPGHPTGQPRKEYTQADDDFLCRYLAAHYPKGSWASRKTFETMTSHTRQYPIAQNHSHQSWHERFKKNSVMFSKRVQGLVDAGIDETLRTKEERGRAQAAPAAKVGNGAVAAASSAVTQREAAIAGPANPPPTQSASQAPEQKQVAGKRALVGSDTDSDNDDAAQAKEAAAKGSKNGPSPTIAPPGPTAEDKETGQVIATPAASHSAAPVPGPSRSQPLQGDSVIVDQSLGLGPMSQPPHGQSAGGSFSESQQSARSDASDAPTQPAGAETQAILNDFVHMQAIAQAKKLEAIRKANQVDLPSTDTSAQVVVEKQSLVVEHTRIQAEADNTFGPAKPVISASPHANAQAKAGEGSKPPSAVDRAEASTRARAASRPRSPQAAIDIPPPPAKRPRHTEPIHPSDTVAARSGMPAPRSVARAPRITQAADGSGRQHMSVPVRINFNVVGITQDGSTEEEGEAEVYKPRRQHRASVNGEITTPRSHREHLRDHVGSSVSGSSRRQARQSHGSARRHHSPDTIYASPAIPPPAPRPPPADSPPTSIRVRRRSSTPPVRDRHAAILDGQEIARRHAETYKAHISRLSTKYGAKPGEVYRALDSTKEPGEVKLPWAEIERRLDAFYQFAS